MLEVVVRYYVFVILKCFYKNTVSATLRLSTESNWWFEVLLCKFYASLIATLYIVSISLHLFSLNKTIIAEYYIWLVKYVFIKAIFNCINDLFLEIFLIIEC